MDTPRHRIAHIITQSAPFGGAQRNTLVTVEGLVRDGHETDLICGPGGPLIPEAMRAGAQVHVIPDLVRELDPVNDVRALVRLCRLFNARRYAIVHTHSVKAGVLGRLAAWWACVPVIIHTLHGVPFEIRRDAKSRFYLALERFMGAFTDCFVCVGEALRQEMCGWKIAPDEKLVTIYSGIDFFAYTPTRAPLVGKQACGAEAAWPVVGCVGRLCEQKAQYYLIEAVALLRMRYPRIKLLLVGEGELRAQLERQIQKAGLTTHVALLGERNDVPDLLNIFDIYAMSSRWEGVGRALTEAMYRGLPIVATSVNGVREVIVDEETGLLVPPRDPSALAKAIERLSADPELAKRLGTNAKRKASELMDSRQMVAGIEALYERLLSRNRPRQADLTGLRLLQ